MRKNKKYFGSNGFPHRRVEEQPQEVQFFSLLRNLVLTGYFTSEVGIKELDYRGNMPNIWDGVPQDVLDEMACPMIQHGSQNVLIKKNEMRQLFGMKRIY